MVSAGVQYAIALKADGTISTWGRNDYGQLGNGQAAMRVTPAKVDGIDHVTAVVAGNNFTLALVDDGTVWGWGSNGNSQLGDGTTQNKSHPVRVIGLVGVVKSVAASSSHALAVTMDGNVWGWGWGLYGQLGNGGGSNLSALKVPGLPAVGKVATGAYHSLALASDGTVWAWGDNSNGQLGDGTTNQRLTPIRINALSNIVAISTTSRSNLALDTSGRVWAWGKGSWGALGDGSYNDRTTPFIVPGLPKITAIVAGNRVSVVTAGDGSVWMWGDNESGQFGDIRYITQPSPVKVSTLAGLSGFSVGDVHIVAHGLSGVLQAWGGNGYGQLGVGDANDRSVPTLVTAPAQFKQVSAGYDHTVAVAGDGSVWAWGANGSGQLADGTVSVSNRPIDVQGAGNIVAISAGHFHVLALSGDGSVWAWGSNPNGALGNGSRRNSVLPQRIPALPAMSAIAGGSGFSLSLEQNGNVWSWGSGSKGQLGIGQIGALLTPMKLTTISGVTQLSANQHVLAVRQDGSVWAWGPNNYGQLGDGATTDRSIPTRVTGLSNEVIAVSAGAFHSLALDRSGNVWAWGNNSAGELGDGTTADRHTPVRVVGLNNPVAIAAGLNVSYAITQDGRFWAWGWNREGELGTGSLDSYSLLARPIEGLVGFQGIAGGPGSAVALRSDGTVWAWGRNFEGQLGDATFAQHNTPALTVNATVNGPLDLNPQVANSIPLDKIPPFFATTSRAGDLSRFSVSTTTKFNTADVGKLGAVFVTAMVPSGSLGVAQQATSESNMPLATARTTSAVSAFVLMQLTPSGWQPVVNGQLIPYASGVMGDQLAAQTILNGTDTTNLNGAAFCVGYGASAAEMTAADRMRTVVTIPDPNSTGLATGSCNVVAGAPALLLTGLWWNQNESGWGISLTQRGSMVFVAWYTYDPTGQPTWLVMSSCPVVGSSCTGDIYDVKGGTPLGVPWNGGGKVVTKVGTGTLTFSDNNTGTFNYSVNGVNGARNVSRQLFATGAAQPAIDYSALWWNENESGWGVALTQQYGVIFATMYSYNASGKPFWYVASNCVMSGNGCSGELYQVTGGSAPTVTWNGANKVVTQVGTVSFVFNDSSLGTMTYTINGVSGSKAISRQLF